ncbi:basic blue protein [Ricinus communis]|uniref:Basic blue protein n=1 Tax=Ricinus communis TaxID=3988 RepID=B9S2N2_RICCO|nr:basic blue protein [Ricinus communis]EEF42037.1 Basic blue protein, putative [Ricinus communis]|eukprot:XP_002520251.1 basic blue protein [Ricinus communis]
MAQGRGSANLAIATVVALLCLLTLTKQVRAATYTVGGSGGWTFNVDSWPKGKRFKAGDTLVFNYDSTVHNVVAVNKGSYTSCSAPAGAKVYTSGRDQIKLAKGQNFFICGISGHCQSGMKIAITAA